MLVYPEFMVGFIKFQIRDVDVRITTAASRAEVIGQKLSVFIEKVPFPLVALLRFHLFLVVLHLLFSLIQVVRSRGRSAPQFLFVGYLVEVGVFAETEVELVEVAPFLVVALVEGVLWRVVDWGGQALDYLYVIVHVETSFGDVVHVLASFLGLAVLSLSDDFAGIEILFKGLILCVIPGDVAVCVVEVHGSGRDHCLWVVHDQNYQKLLLLASYIFDCKFELSLQMKCWQKVLGGTASNRRGSNLRQIRLRTVQSNPSTISLDIKPLEAMKSELSMSVKARLEEQIAVMMTTIRRIVEWEGAELRQAMNYVRSSVLFKDIDGINAKIVDQLVGQYASNKISMLQATISELRTQISQMKEQIKSEHQFNEINLRSNSVFINPTGNAIHQLFLKAKSSSLEDFTAMYNKMHPKNQKPYRLKNNEGAAASNHDNYKIKTSLQDYLEPILLGFKQEEKVKFLQLMRQQMKCNRPCCKWGLEDSIMGSPAQKYRKGEPNIRSQSVYQNSNFNQYYQRYCGKDFKLSNVVSITRTHNEQIQKIYTKIKNQQKQKTRQHQRHKSVA